jgi:hypothetical protein
MYLLTDGIQNIFFCLNFYFPAIIGKLPNKKKVFQGKLINWTLEIFFTAGTLYANIAWK